jgi:taurine transport system substrate-binding protein
VKKDGTVLTSAGALAKKGRPTFDAIMVNRPWAEQNKEFMVALVKAIAQKDAEYKANKAQWTADSAAVKSIAKISGAEVATVPPTLAAYAFPSLQEQASNAWLSGGKESGAAKALLETAKFLKEQGRITDVAPDYGKFVTDVYAKAAASGS